MDTNEQTPAELSLDWKPVTSSNIAALAYVPTGEFGTLYVKFTNGAVWSYADVPKEKFDAMTDPEIESVGRYFNAEIKAGYEATKVSDVAGQEGERQPEATEPAAEETQPTDQAEPPTNPAAGGSEPELQST